MEGANLTKAKNSKVPEFPFYSTRLRNIDWKAVVASGKPFEDPYFLADVSSIHESTLEMRSGIEQWKGYEWKRPSEIFGEGNFSLYDKIAPDDIKQGECGDCYFLSSLSSIAEKPERI